MNSMISLPQFSSPLYIGGIESTTNATQFHLESSLSLISTISSLRIDHALVQYNTVVSAKSIVLGSVRTGSLCQPNSCRNNQQCIDLWINDVCNCKIGYSGELCEVISTVHLEPASALQFVFANYTNVQFDFTVQTDSGFLMTISTVSLLYISATLY